MCALSLSVCLIVCFAYPIRIREIPFLFRLFAALYVGSQTDSAHMHTFLTNREIRCAASLTNICERIQNRFCGCSIKSTISRLCLCLTYLQWAAIFTSVSFTFFHYLCTYCRIIYELCKNEDISRDRERERGKK